MTEPNSSEPNSVGPGRVLGGKYRVEKIIGSGGMGIVVSARHVTMSHRVAIKILNLDPDADRVEAMSRFQREALAAARIESDHVVRVTDVAALEDGTPYMVMEYLEGDDFRKILHERGQLPIAEAVAYVLEACEGLSEAHAAGVVHRDLKPSNLFLAKKPNGTQVVKVLDFGISKVAARPGEVAITTTDTLMGSPVYMAPEQMRSTRTVDSRADIWSLGLILYELLAGETAFGGDTVPEVCVAVMSGEPEAISRFRDDVPLELQAVLLKCMVKEREKRYATMAALARDLAPFAHEGARVHADRASAALKAARPGAETQPEVEVPKASTPRARRTPAQAPPPQDPETLKSWSRGRRGATGSKRNAWLAVGALACVLAAIGGAKLALSPSRSGDARSTVASASAPVSPVVPSASPQATSTASDELASVPVDSLPLAARDSGSPRAPRVFAPPSSPPPRASAEPAPPPPSATASAPPPKKDDWKWGDRN